MKETERPVVVSTNWGNAERSCTVAVTTWNRIISGFKVIRTVPYYYAGELYKSCWEFNIYGHYSVRVTYSKAGGELGEGLGFEGALRDLSVTYFDRRVTELSKLIKLDRLYKKFEIYFEETQQEDSSFVLIYIYISKKQPGHVLNFILESIQGNVLREVNFKGIQTARGVLDSINSGWKKLFDTDPPVAALKQILQKIEQKDPELASLIIREPSLNHAQTLFEWN